MNSGKISFSNFSKANTGVIWDMNECPVPLDSLPHAYVIYTKITSFLASKNYKGFVEVFGFELSVEEKKMYDDDMPSDEKKMYDDDDDDMPSDEEDEIMCPTTAQRMEDALDEKLYNYHAAGIFLERGDESAIANKKIATVLSWASDNPAPANLVVISKNIAQETFLISVLRTLKARNYNLVLLQHSSEDSQPEDLVPVGSVWRWKRVFNERIPRFELRYKKRETTALGSTARCNTGVFWDVDDCSIPLHRTLGSIRQGIVNCIHGFGNPYSGDVSIKAYASSAKKVNLGQFGVSVYRCGARYQTDARGHRIDIMVKDILLWALMNLRQPSDDKPNLLIIAKNVSKNLEFKAILHDLQKRNFHVVLALPQDVDEGPKVERLFASSAPLHKQSGY